MAPKDRQRLPAGTPDGSGLTIADTIMAASAGPAEPMMPKPLAAPKIDAKAQQPAQPGYRVGQDGKGDQWLARGETPG